MIFFTLSDDSGDINRKSRMIVCELGVSLQFSDIQIKGTCVRHGSSSEAIINIYGLVTSSRDPKSKGNEAAADVSNMF